MPISRKSRCSHTEKAITIPADVLYQYEIFSRYNSPYRAHQGGCAVDLYPPGDTAPSPVGGEVIDIRAVKPPTRPYATEEDYLIVIDTEGGDIEYRRADDEPAIARIMHVKPDVSTGERVRVGDPLGRLVRSGFFAPWVENHLHVGFRSPDRNYLRASGSLPLETDVDVKPLAWDGRGRAVEIGETYVVLDLPEHPEPGKSFVGIGDDSGRIAIDGGLPHFGRGGTFAGHDGPVELLGTEIGRSEGYYIKWKPVKIYANGSPIKGISLFASMNKRFGARLVCPEVTFEEGEMVDVEIGYEH